MTQRSPSTRTPCRSARRRKKVGRIIDGLPVPGNLARILRQQPQQRPQQGGLAAADAPGNDGERALADVQVDRKVLAYIAATDAATFSKLADVAKTKLN